MRESYLNFFSLLLILLSVLFLFIDAVSINGPIRIPHQTPSLNRRSLAGAGTGSKLMFAGGSNGITSLDLVEVYDILLRQWSTARLSAMRSDLAGVGWMNKIMFAGGFSALLNKSSAVVDIYDSVTNSWVNTSLSVARHSLAASAIGSQIFFGGGITDEGIASDVIDVFDLTIEGWITPMQLSEARYNLSSAATGIAVAFAGGSTAPSSPSSRVDIYNINTRSWKTASLSQPRSNLGAAAASNKMVFACGLDADGLPTNLIDIYDVLADTWTTSSLTSMPRNAIAVAVGTFILIAAPDSDVVDVYDALTGQWSTLNLNLTSLSLTAAATNGTVFFTGGESFSSGFSINNTYILTVPENRTSSSVSNSVLLIDNTITVDVTEVLIIEGDVKLTPSATLRTSPVITNLFQHPMLLNVSGCALIDGTLNISIQYDALPNNDSISFPILYSNSQCNNGTFTFVNLIVIFSYGCQEVYEIQQVASPDSLELLLPSRGDLSDSECLTQAKYIQIGAIIGIVVALLVFLLVLSCVVWRKIRNTTCGQKAKKPKLKSRLNVDI